MSIISLLLPNGKMGKYVKCVFSLLVVFVVLKPVVFLGDNNATLDQIYSDVHTDIPLQENYLDFVFEKKVESLEQNCEKLLENHQIFNVNIKIDVDSDYFQELRIKKVTANFENAVIKSENKHIDIIDVKNIIADYLGVSNNVVEIYQ